MELPKQGTERADEMAAKYPVQPVNLNEWTLEVLNLFNSEVIFTHKSILPDWSNFNMHAGCDVKSVSVYPNLRNVTVRVIPQKEVL
jgi:hypothetical protein